MFCRECGAEMAEDSVICEWCGAPIAKEIVSPTPVDAKSLITGDNSAPEIAPAVNRSTAVLQEDEYSAPTPNMEPVVKKAVSKKKPKKKNKYRSAIIKAVLTTVLCMLCLFAVLLLSLLKSGIIVVRGQSIADTEAPEQALEEEQETVIPCVGLVLSDTEVALNGLGKTATISTKVFPADCTLEIGWKSGNDAVATVENGVITAVADGSCTITASCGDISETVGVTVIAPDAEIDDETIRLNHEDVTLSRPFETLQLTVYNAGDMTVEWRVENENILALEEDGLVKAIGTGTTEVFATVGGEYVFKCIVRCELGGVEGEPIRMVLNRSDVTLPVGKTVTLKVVGIDGEPYDCKPHWKSDSSSCTVDSGGVVCARKAGTAYISTVVEGVTLKCIIRVIEADN